MKEYDIVRQATLYIREQLLKDRQYDNPVGIILGSGLGEFGESLLDPIRISYGDVPGLSPATVAGHAGAYIFGYCGRDARTPVIVMQGRSHSYEKLTLDEVVRPARTMAELGCRVVILTAAVGAINRFYKPGEFVFLRDHINWSDLSPLIGEHDENFGPQFVDLTTVYDTELTERARYQATLAGVYVHDGGVYMWRRGPTYETPAEIDAARRLGATVAGMSTVPEAIALHQMGVSKISLCLVTNMAAGVTGKKLGHDEVVTTGRFAKEDFMRMLPPIVSVVALRQPGLDISV